MRKRLLLLKKETSTGYSVFQRNRRHRHTVILIYDCLLRCVNRMKHNFILQIIQEHLRLQIQQFLQLFGCIDMKGCSSSHQTESGNHADQTKAMITMKMRDKDRRNAAERLVGSSQLHLRSLTAINHKQLPSHLHNL